MTDLTITAVSKNRRILALLALEVLKIIEECPDVYADISISAEEEELEQETKPAKPKETKPNEP